MKDTPEIIELDKTLSLLREGWMAAKSEDKDKYMQQINYHLDERSKLMAIRDGKA